MKLVPIVDELKLDAWEESFPDDDFIYIDGGLQISHEEDDSFYHSIYKEDKNLDPPMARLEEDLARRLATIANMRHYY